MTNLSDLRSVTEVDPHLIRRHGMYFRPGAHGYTDDVAQAGVFSREEAERYLDVEGLTIHRLHNYGRLIEEDVSKTEERLALLHEKTALLAALSMEKTNA